MFKKEFKFEEKKEGTEGAPPPAEKPADNKPGEQVIDAFGYAKPPESNEKPAEKTETKVDPPKEDKIENPGTGYSAEKPKEDSPSKVDPPAPTEELKLDYEIELKDVPKEEAETIKKFAKDNALTKEAAQAFANFRKGQIEAQNKLVKEYQENQEKSVRETKSKWDKELREDPTFGGDKFAHNIMRAEKVLKDFMPETKKMLTERKSMLPPYVMRDLFKLASRLYDSENFVQGEQASADKKVDSEFSHLDFYNSSPS